MVEKISKLKDRVTGILDSNKVALRSEGLVERSLQLRRRGRGADGAKRDPDPQVVAALVKDCQWLAGGAGRSTSDASHPSPKPQTTVKVRPRCWKVPPMSNSHVVGLSLRMGSACAGSGNPLRCAAPARAGLSDP